MIQKKCPECGSDFIPATDHIFKKDGKVFCRWSCYIHYVAKAEEEKKKGGR